MAPKKTSKKALQDIVPAERRSIRNVAVEHVSKAPSKLEDKPIRRRPRAVVVEGEVEEKPAPRVEPKVEHKAVFMPRKPAKKKGTGKNSVIIFLVICVCLAVIGFAISLLYSQAVVTIVPKEAHFNIDGTERYTAKKNPVASELGYEVVNISDEVKETVTATKGPLIQSKAKGTVNIYNNYSAAAQKLLAGT
jgi:hypothetical protein